MEFQNSTEVNITQTSTGDVAASIVMSLCFVIGIPGNIITIALILHHFKKDNFSLHLMLNLAVSDILCLGTLPLWIYYLRHGWVFDSALCKVLFTWGTLAMHTSVLTVTLMSVQRYLIVVRRKQWERLGDTGERALLLGLWVVAGLMSIPSAVWADIQKINTQMKCRRVPVSSGSTLTILSFEFLLGFGFPFSILVSSYCRLYRDVNKAVFFRHRRLTRLVTRVVAAFFIFSSPVYLLFPVEIVALAIKPTEPMMAEKIWTFYKTCANVAVSLIFVNSCVNPLLYAFSSRKLFTGTEKPSRSLERD